MVSTGAIEGCAFQVGHFEFECGQGIRKFVTKIFKDAMLIADCLCLNPIDMLLAYPFASFTDR
jgi:hypothetical protein